MNVLPPRYWPAGLWVTAGAVVLLLAHAIGLGVHLLLIETSGGRPSDSEVYTGQVLGGFIPALGVLIVGLFGALWAMRQQDEGVVMLGRVFLAALGVLTVALIGFGVPLLAVPR